MSLTVEDNPPAQPPSDPNVVIVYQNQEAWLASFLTVLPSQTVTTWVGSVQTVQSPKSVQVMRDGNGVVTGVVVQWQL
jgi:hypothetical protein